MRKKAEKLSFNTIWKLNSGFFLFLISITHRKTGEKIVEKYLDVCD